MKYLLSLLLFIGLAGCSDAEKAAFKAFGQRHKVVCYSGGIIIYSGYSTGKILNEDHSDGYYFEDEATHKLVSVSGNCVITLEEQK